MKIKERIKKVRKRDAAIAAATLLTIAGVVIMMGGPGLACVLHAPADASSAEETANGTVFFQYNASGSVVNASLYSNQSGSWAFVVLNSTAVSTSEVNSIAQELGEGTYLWNVLVCDSTDCVFSTSNYTFTVTLTCPNPC